jgi:hypothetical protein
LEYNFELLISQIVQIINLNQTFLMAVDSRVTNHNEKLTDEAITLQNLEGLRKINTNQQSD